MSAKEALRELGEGLSEEEAARWLGRMKPHNDQPLVTTFEKARKRPLLIKRANPGGLLAYRQWLRSQPPAMLGERSGPSSLRPSMRIDLTAPSLPMNLVLLDSGPLGTLVHPRRSGAFNAWLAAQTAGGNEVTLLEITYDELRREVVRIQSQMSLATPDRLAQDMAYAPVTTSILIRASELWAQVRREGRPTARDDALDVDVILVATALEIRDLGHDVTMATTNPRHIERFVAAAHWEDITP